MGRRTWAVVVAAGNGLRLGGEIPKQYLTLDPGVSAAESERTVGGMATGDEAARVSDDAGGAARPAMLFEQALAPFLSHPAIAGLVLVVPAADCDWVAHRLRTRWLTARWLQARCTQGRALGWRVARAFDGATTARPLVVVPGGAERIDSVRAGLEAAFALAMGGVTESTRSAAGDDDWVLVHDGARPCLSEADLTALIAWRSPGRGEACSGVVLAAESVDSLKEVDATGRIVAAPDRRRIWRALTPQGFPLAPLLAAVTEATQADAATRAAWTDEASVWAACGWPVYVLRGHADNIKVTRPEDVRRALDWLSRHHPERRLV